MSDKPAEKPIDLTDEEIKAREAHVAADVAARNAAKAPETVEPTEAEKEGAVDRQSTGLE